MQASIQLNEGDLVVLPHGHAHTIYDQSEQLSLSTEVLLSQAQALGERRIMLGEGEVQTRTICGIFYVDPSIHIPVWQACPAFIHVRREDTVRFPWFTAALTCLTEEANSSVFGAPLMATKAAEMVFLLALRVYLSTASSNAHGWLCAARDPQIGKAIALMHNQFAEPWTVATLGAQVGMSRSSFAAKFQKLTGQSPMRYLTERRLQVAARLIRERQDSVYEIAYQVGYLSFVGFYNAFKQHYHVPPGKYRHQMNSNRQSNTECLDTLRN